MLIVDDADLVAECRAFNAQLAELLATLSPIDAVPPEVTRRAQREGRGIFRAPTYDPRARELTAGGVPARAIPPDGEATGVYLHIHGGGHVIGSADGQDPLLAELVDATGLVALSVDYRLAPEHPFPAAVEDCESAALWLVREGAQELGAPPVFAIGGESAGAHLAALTLLRLRDRHGLTPFRAANLVYGAYDLAGTLPSRLLWGDRDLVLSLPLIKWFGDCFLPGLSTEQRRSPEISPLYADLTGMPPALFTVGTLDPLLDDSLFMEARWRAAGNRSELRVYAEAAHSFNMYPLAVAARANAAQHAFLREALA